MNKYSVTVYKRFCDILKSFIKLLRIIKSTLSKIFDAEETIIFIFFVLFILAFFIQVFYYFVYFRKAYLNKEKINQKKSIKQDPVSVIICSHNEASNLRKNLPFIMEQDYKDYEVIVVDDRSEDGTEELLSEFSKKYPHLLVSKVKNDPQFMHGKKLALLLGIKASSNEWLLLTDADCCPASKKWLSQMQKNFKKDIHIVLGYGGYRKAPGLLNMVIRFETVFTAMNYFGMALAGKPYMGVGRNLAYRKSLFFSNNGFASHTGLRSGDDDLFVNETSTSDNTAVEMHPDSYTWSDPEKTFESWYRQKKRHLTTGPRYSAGSMFRLLLEHFSRIVLIISLMIILFKSPDYLYFLAAFLILYVYKITIYKIVFSRFNERYLFLPSVILEPLLPILYGYIHAVNFIERKRFQWK